MVSGLYRVMKRSCRAVFILFFLSGCGPGRPRQNDIVKSDSARAGRESKVSGCAKGEPVAIARNSFFPSTSFKLNDDHQTATETVVLDNADKLVINHWGCAYYEFTFRFETDRFQADPADLAYWIDKAIVLMTEIEKGLDAPVDIPGGTGAIRNYVKEKTEYKLGEGIRYNSDLIYNMVTIDTVQKLTEKKFAIELTYSRGPL